MSTTVLESIGHESHPLTLAPVKLIYTMACEMERAEEVKRRFKEDLVEDINRRKNGINAIMRLRTPNTAIGAFRYAKRLDDTRNPERPWRQEDVSILIVVYRHRNDKVVLLIGKEDDSHQTVLHGATKDDFHRQLGKYLQEYLLTYPAVQQVQYDYSRINLRIQ